MKKVYFLSLGLLCVLLFWCCANRGPENNDQAGQKITVIFDTDANNELDDQHALAYLFFNSDTFSIKAVTVNTTYNGGNIDEQYAEAERVMKLCEVSGKIPLLKGANGSFTEIESDLANPEFDGKEAVDFIIEEAKKQKTGSWLLLLSGNLRI